MKRIFLVLGLILGFQMMKAQDMIVSPESNFNSVKRKVEKSDQDIQDQKKNINPKTWYNRGEVMQDAFEVNNIKMLRKDMSATFGTC